jgi:hypothetical protein
VPAPGDGPVRYNNLGAGAATEEVNMDLTRTLQALVVGLGLIALGCSGQPSSGRHDDEAKIEANLAKLAPEDRRLAEAQRFCVVESDHRLGSMGKPVKVVVKGEPVFLCCKGCEKEALADPDRTLARVKDLKAASGPK